MNMNSNTANVLLVLILALSWTTCAVSDNISRAIVDSNTCTEATP